MVNFVGKLCLAPMVRSGELPTRLMALKYGADLVWTPEVVDKKIIQTTKIFNDKINTIDYIVNEANNKSKKKNNSPRVVFRTLPKLESSKLIFQLGSADPKLAVEAALKVVEDVDGIDLNCGCPKPFSTHSGMGAALLSTPDLLCSILSNLVEKVGKPFNKPISCKIRLLDSLSNTKNLIEKICNTGISNLTIHCRTRDMRNRDDPIWTYLPEIIPFVQKKGISVVINGNIQCRKDFENMQVALKNKEIGGMIAECAEANPSVFSSQPLVAKQSIAQFLDIAKIYNYDCIQNTKYLILSHVPGKSPYYQKFARQKTHDDMLEILKEITEGDDDLLGKILTKDLQKQKYLSEAEYWQFIASRKLEMEQNIQNAAKRALDEDEEEHIVTKKAKIDDVHVDITNTKLESEPERTSVSA